MTLDDILAAAYPVLPVLVIEQPDHAIPLAETLVAQGVRVLEITCVLTRCWRSSTPLPGTCPRPSLVPAQCSHPSSSSTSKMLAPSLRSALVSPHACGLWRGSLKWRFYLVSRLPVKYSSLSNAAVSG